MAELPPRRLSAAAAAALIVAGASAHVARRETVARGEPGSRDPGRLTPPPDLDARAAPLQRPTLPPSVAGDVERLRQAEARRARKAARNAKGMHHG